MISQQSWTAWLCPAFQFQAGTAAFAAVTSWEQETRACEYENRRQGDGERKRRGGWGRLCAPSPWLLAQEELRGQDAWTQS